MQGILAEWSADQLWIVQTFVTGFTEAWENTCSGLREFTSFDRNNNVVAQTWTVQMAYLLWTDCFSNLWGFLAIFYPVPKTQKVNVDYCVVPENIHTPPTHPPPPPPHTPGNCSLFSYFSSKSLALKIPLPLGISNDCLWNHRQSDIQTYFLEPHNNKWWHYFVGVEAGELEPRGKGGEKSMGDGKRYGMGRILKGAGNRRNWGKFCNRKSIQGWVQHRNVRKPGVHRTMYGKREV